MYRIRCRSEQVLSLDSPSIMVYALGRAIRIVRRLEGIENAGLRPVRRVTLLDFEPIAETVEVEGEFIISGDVESSVSASLGMPQVQVLDEFGSALARASDVKIRIFTCGLEYRELSSGKQGIPWPVPEGCEEMRNWEVSPARFLCLGTKQDEDCDQGITTWQNFWIDPSVKTGFYWVFFTADGVVQRQDLPLYIVNGNVPSDGAIVSYRAGVMCIILIILPLFVTNLDSRGTSWSKGLLGLSSIFGLLTALHVITTVTWYGDITRVPIELSILGAALILNLGLIILLLFRLVFGMEKTQYFTRRQAAYLASMRELFISQHGPRSRPSSGGKKVHPAKEFDDLDGVTPKDEDEDDETASKESDRDLSPEEKQNMERIMAARKLRSLGEGMLVKGEDGDGGVLGGSFQYPVRLLMGAGMSSAAVLIFLVLINSIVNTTIYSLNLLRAEVVGYREALGNGATSMDDESDYPGVPTPPYSTTYNYIAMAYTLVESFYQENDTIFDSLILSMTISSIAGSAVTGASFCFAWYKMCRSYKEKMFQIRYNPNLIDSWKFPVVEAGGYVGRQMWSSVISALFVYMPIALFTLVLSWGPTQLMVLLWFFIPLAGLVVLEVFSLALRRLLNASTTVNTPTGVYITNRPLFGLYDFIGLYLHVITGPALAVTRLAFTYADFAVSIGRLDRPVLQGRISHYDTGHASYVAMMYLDYIYNAPVSSLLAHSLARLMEARDRKKWEDLADISQEALKQRRKEANARLNRNRWQLLFTQRCNPEVKKLRRLPPAPTQAWDRDEIRDFEQEVEDDVGAWEAVQQAKLNRVRLAAKLMGGPVKRREKPDSKQASPNGKAEVGSTTASPMVGSPMSAVGSPAGGQGSPAGGGGSRRASVTEPVGTGPI
uniref:Receptor for retinol uptake STRA6 n=1 Tax=Hemiselmis tepida TaxID=464990 RepID=A0A7S0YUF8_9CRYP